MPKRKPNRLHGYDYSQNGAYFVTICIKDKHELLGKIVGSPVLGRPSTTQTIDCSSTLQNANCQLSIPNHDCPTVELTELGKITDTAIKHNNRENVSVDCYVIMPNHIHIIFVLSSKTNESPPKMDDISSQTGDRGRSPLQMIVRNMKAWITKQAGFSPWQKSFYDRIIRNDAEYIHIADYIKNNPARWKEDCFYPTNVTP